MIVRPFNTYGPNSHHEGDRGEVIPRFIVRAMNGLPPVIFGDPNNARDFTYVRDTVEGILRAADCDAMIGETLNIATGTARTVGDVAAAVLAATGRRDLEPIQGRPRPGDVHMHQADTSKARKLLGWQADTTLEEGIRLFLEHLARSGADFHKMLSEHETYNWE